jgi:hypothetical protein
MTLQDVVGLNVVVFKEAIGALEHCGAPTGFGKRSSGVLSQSVGELHQALGAPQVTEVSIGKFIDRPVGGSGETHN